MRDFAQRPHNPMIEEREERREIRFWQITLCVIAVLLLLGFLLGVKS